MSVCRNNFFCFLDIYFFFISQKKQTRKKAQIKCCGNVSKPSWSQVLQYFNLLNRLWIQQMFTMLQLLYSHRVSSVMDSLLCVVIVASTLTMEVYEEDSLSCSLICVHQLVITPFSLSDIDSSAPDTVKRSHCA